MTAIALLVLVFSVLGSLFCIFVDTSFTVKPETRLVGSEKTFATLFPYQVSIKAWRNNLLYTRSYGWCGGCILSANWVLTAAHCVHNRTAHIYMGSALRRSHVKFDIEKSKILVHSGYDGNYGIHDIALIRTPTITFSSYVKPIKLPTQPIDFGYYDQIVTGWDTKNEDRFGLVFMKITSDKECRRTFSNYNEYNICAKPSAKGTVCDGDSGSPLVNFENSTSVLIGIVSGGDSRCKDSSPVILMRVSSYRTWIIHLIT